MVIRRSTGSAAADGELADLDAEDVVGQRIREFRSAKGWSLRDLAARTDLSIGFLSQVERGLSSIALSTLREVAAALGHDIVDFFATVDEAARGDDAPAFTLTRAGPSPQTVVSGGRSYQLLSDRRPGLILEPMLVHIGPGQDREGVYGHEGEEFAYVLEGELLYTVESTDYRLGPGDSLHLRSNVPHRMHNDTTETTVVVSVVTPRLF